MAWEDLGEDTVGKQDLSSIVSTFSLTLLTPVSLITEVRSQHGAEVTAFLEPISCNSKCPGWIKCAYLVQSAKSKDQASVA